MFKIIDLEKGYVSCIQYGMIFEYGSKLLLVREYGLWAELIQPPRALRQSARPDPTTPSRGYISREPFSRFIFSLQPREKAAPRNSSKPLGHGDSMLGCSGMNILFT